MHLIRPNLFHTSKRGKPALCMDLTQLPVPPLGRPQPSYGDDFVPQLKKAALDNGLTFVGPDLAAEVAKGDMESFTKLVQATRKAVEED